MKTFFVESVRCWKGVIVDVEEGLWRERDELTERYSIAHSEYRQEVLLGWDRMKTFLIINPSFTVILALKDGTTLPMRLAFAAAACIALAGVFVVNRSHSRFRATMVTVNYLEKQLGIEDIQTTGGQRERLGMLRMERYRIVDVVTVVFVVIAVIDVVLAGWS
jgi:hypothetical protein